MSRGISRCSFSLLYQPVCNLGFLRLSFRNPGRPLHPTKSRLPLNLRWSQSAGLKGSPCFVPVYVDLFDHYHYSYHHNFLVHKGLMLPQSLKLEAPCSTAVIRASKLRCTSPILLSESDTLRSKVLTEDFTIELLFSIETTISTTTAITSATRL